jgi:oligosaccharide repeat unit polymerase
MNYLHIILATIIFSSGVVVSRFFEKRWISPAVVFIYAFYAHAFLAPIAALEYISAFNLDTFSEATILALVALFFVVLGYFFFSIRSIYRPRKYKAELGESIFGGHSYLPGLLLMFFLGASIVDFFASGGLTGVRGQDSYEAGTMSGAFSLMAVPIFIAIFIGVFTETAQFRKVALPLLLVSLAIIVWISVLTFGRHKVLLILLACGMYYHFRVKAFSLRYVGIGVLFVFFVSIFSTNRRFGGSALELSYDEVLESLDLFFESPFDAIISVIAPLAGFEVFTQVISLVPSVEGFMYGKTYMQSLVGLLFPKFIFGELVSFETPAFWFHRIYSPYTTGHGFDFSMLSEAYINFGIFGIAAFVIIGYLVGFLSKVIMHSRNSFFVFAALYILAVLIVGLRNDSNAMFKNAFYSVMFVAIVRGFLGLRAR